MPCKEVIASTRSIKIEKYKHISNFTDNVIGLANVIYTSALYDSLGSKYCLSQWSKLIHLLAF